MQNANRLNSYYIFTSRNSRRSMLIYFYDLPHLARNQWVVLIYQVFLLIIYNMAAPQLGSRAKNERGVLKLMPRPLATNRNPLWLCEYNCSVSSFRSPSPFVMSKEAVEKLKRRVLQLQYRLHSILNH
jgi:hypothetical protein